MTWCWISATFCGIGVKRTSSPTPGDFERLDKTADVIGAGRRVLIARATGPLREAGRDSDDLPTFLEHLTTEKGHER